MTITLFDLTKGELISLTIPLIMEGIPTLTLRCVSARELIKLLHDDGWIEVRQSGSHKIFKHSSRKSVISVPVHGSRDIPIGTLRAILKQMKT